LLLAHVLAFLLSFLALLFLVSIPLSFSALDAFFSLFFSLFYLFPNGRIELYAGLYTAGLNPKVRQRPYASTLWATLWNRKCGCSILDVMRFEVVAALGAMEKG
jgi:hypothetical protein